MNRCTQLYDISHGHVPRQPHEPYWISRSKVKVIFCKWTKVHPIVFSECVVYDALYYMMTFCTRDICDQSLDLSKTSALRKLMNRGTSLHEIIHVRTCASTSRTILNFEVIGLSSRSRGFFGVFLCAWYCGYLQTVLSLEQGLMILFILFSW